MLKDIEQHARIYKCEPYEVKAHERSCFFCKHCTDIFYDYAHGPYMFLCVKEQNITNGLMGKCSEFIDDGCNYD